MLLPILQLRAKSVFMKKTIAVNILMILLYYFFIQFIF